MKQIGLLMVWVLSIMELNAQPDGDSQIAIAQKHFEHIRQLCMQPQAQLWGRDLMGPVLLVDPVSRKVYANQADREGKLVLTGAVYTGILPPSVNMANTATEWAGIRWTMMLLPLPDGPYEQSKLMAHELYHRIQGDLGFMSGSPVCDHLDSREGRILFRLELQALAAALRTPLTLRRNHLQRAIAFRQARYAKFPAAREVEETLEMNEGLAEFTGVYVSDITRHDTGYLSKLADSAAKLFPSFARSAAYLTGPLYGILLSQQHDGWQRSLSAKDNLPGELIKWYRIKAPKTDTASLAKAMRYYEGDKITGEEEAREAQRRQREKAYLSKLVDGPVLELLFSKKMSVSFNPSILFPLGDHGTVYPHITVTDEWGRIEVKGDALMHNWQRLKVSMPQPPQQGAILTTAEWTLELAAGWLVVPGPRSGDFLVKKQEGQ